MNRHSLRTLLKKEPMISTPKELDPVLIDGVRTPFLRSNGAFTRLSTYQLGSKAIAGLLNKTGIDPKLVGHVTMGCVIASPKTPNVAREAALVAGIPHTTPAHTVTLACISANVAATSLADRIRLGQIDVAIAGGTENLSDPPIQVSQNVRLAMVKAQKAKGLADYIKILRELSLKDIIPDIPAVAEFSTGESMGEGCERLLRQAQVTREETDQYAVRSHQLAAKAWEEGNYNEGVTPVEVPPKFAAVIKDDGPRGDSTMEKLAKLRPAFDKIFGVSTAGNSSFLTDGASAVLLMSRKRAQELGFKPKAILKDYVYAGGDPLDELLTGPALTIPKLLDKNGLKILDISVWEIHEAFSAQMVAMIKLLKSEKFCRERLGRDGALGEIPLEKMNVWGGSLSLGHPFGATGGRLLETAARRLERGGGRYAVVAGCAAGGHGSAILLENLN
jgi:acetyl-CoA acyltransferase